MRSFTIALALLMGALSVPSHAINLKVSRQDMKLATQQLMEKDTMSSPIVADDNRILDGDTGDTDGSGATVTTFLAQPDVARNLTVLPGDTTADVAAGSVVISGTDLHGVAISEGFAFLANASTAQTGNAAFLTVTSISFPAEDSPYTATWKVGVEDKLGLRRCLGQAGHVVFATLDGVYEATRPTVAQSTAVSGNTANINGTLTGAKDVEIFYVQNFTCLP